MKRPDWKRFFINIAAEVAKRATCIRRAHGAVIVGADNIMKSSGYCGSARGLDNCTDHGHCEREIRGAKPGEHYEWCVSVHAEANAIIACTPEQMKGATIYLAGFDSKTGLATDAEPCMMCERMILNAQIETIVMRKADNSLVTMSSFDLRQKINQDVIKMRKKG